MHTPTIIYEVTLHNNFSLTGHSKENLFSHLAQISYAEANCL